MMFKDVRKIRALGRLILKLEVRNRGGSAWKLAMLLISYLLPGIFIPFLLIKQSTDPTGYEYSIVSYFFFSIIMAFTILSESDNLVISRTETDLFSTLPVNEQLIADAKMYALLRYLFLLSLPLLLPGSIIFGAFTGSVPRAVIYFLSGFMLHLFLTNLLLLVWCFALRNFNLRNLSRYMLIFQLILVLLLVIGYQFITASFTGQPQRGVGTYFHVLQKGDLIRFLPQSWFAFLPSKGNYIVDYILLLKVFLPLFICYMSYLSFKNYLTGHYPALRERFSQAGVFHTSPQSERFSPRALWSNIFQRLFLRNYMENCSYSLMQSLFRHDRFVKLSIVPMAMIPLGLAVFAMVTDQLPNPFGRDYLVVNPVFHISILVSFLITLNAGIVSIRVTNYPEASWIYDAYPLGAKKKFISGVRKFFITHLILPVSLLLLIIFSLRISPWLSFVHVLFIFASALLLNSISHNFSRSLPLTKENTMLSSLHRITSMAGPLALGVAVVTVQVFAYRSIMTALSASAVFIALSSTLNYFGIRKEKTNV